MGSLVLLPVVRAAYSARKMPVAENGPGGWYRWAPTITPQP